MKNILITGGAGFIGSNLVKRLLKDDDINIVCIDNFDNFYSPYIKFKNIEPFRDHPRFQLEAVDILDGDRLKEIASRTKFDVIVHLAAQAGVRPSIENPIRYQKVNILGTQNLLELSKQFSIRQFIFGSSSSVYGINENVPWEEDHKLLPISPYASSKLSCEQLGHVYKELYNIRFIALRFFTVYGPGQRPDLAIHKFTRLIDQGKKIPMYGDGTTKRDYTYVGDITEGIISAIDYQSSDYEIINIGNSRQIALTDLIQRLEKVLGKKANIDRQPEQSGDVPQTYASIEKAGKLLNYEPHTQIEEGLKKFVDWYRNNL